MSHSEDNVKDNEAQNGKPQMSSQQQQYLLEEERKIREETAAIALDIEREKRNHLIIDGK